MPPSWRLGSANFPLLTLLLLPASLIGGAQSPHKPAKHPAQACSEHYVQSSYTSGNTTFKTFRDEEGAQACLRVTQNGSILFQRTSAGWFELGQKQQDDLKIPLITPGTDITGDGHSDVLVSLWTGGAHCCRIDYVFQASPVFHLIATLHARDADQSYFANLDANNRYSYITGDYAFAYWYGSFAGSPTHEVILKFVPNKSGGTYHVDLEKMKRSAPTPEEWNKSLDDVRHELKLKQENMVTQLRTVLWQQVLDLIYTGHPDLAWKFLNEAGPEAQSQHDPDIEAFCSTLKTSYYWPDLKGTLSQAPKACLQAKAEK